MNKYRHKTGPTNVLSFSLSPHSRRRIASLGDLVICAELVQEEAQTENKTVLERWAHLTVHGILHLQGYDHIESEEAEKMEQLEIQYFANLGFSRSLSRF